MTNLFYKSNQQRMRFYNEQRKLDLINQLKQKERIRSINDQEIYNDKVADDLAKLYAKFMTNSSTAKKALTNDVATQWEFQKPSQLLLNAPVQTPIIGAQTSPMTSPIAMLETGLDSPNYKIPTKAKSAPQSPLLASLQGEVKERLSLDPEEVKKVNALKVPDLKAYLDQIKMEYPKNAKKQELRNLAYKTLPKKSETKMEAAGIRRKKKLKMYLKK